MLVVLVPTMGVCVAMSVVATSYLQTESPGHLVGKVVALAVMLANFATPAGQLLYGVLFDFVPAWCVAGLAAAAVAAVALWLRR